MFACVLSQQQQNNNNINKLVSARTVLTNCIVRVPRSTVLYSTKRENVTPSVYYSRLFYALGVSKENI